MSQQSRKLQDVISRLYVNQDIHVWCENGWVLASVEEIHERCIKVLLPTGIEKTLMLGSYVLLV